MENTPKKSKRIVPAEAWPKPFVAWCAHRNLSPRTGYREAGDGRVVLSKIRSRTYVTQEADAAYLASLPRAEIKPSAVEHRVAA